MMSSPISNKPIGLIGAGVMGHCMVLALKSKGYDVVAYDVSPQALDHVTKEGALALDNPAAVAEASDIVLLSLPGSKQCQAALFGSDGLAGASHPVIIVNTSTIDREASQQFAAQLPEGFCYLDGPILGRPSALGKWLIPVGGDAQAIEQVRPVLETFAASVVPVGEVGNGNVLKALNQLMFTVINAVSSEVMALAEASGLTKEMFYHTVAASSAGTVSGLFKEVGGNIVANHFDEPVFTVDLLIKDTQLALSLATQLGRPSLIGELVQLKNKYAQAKGYGSLDTAALFKIFQE